MAKVSGTVQRRSRIHSRVRWWQGSQPEDKNIRQTARKRRNPGAKLTQVELMREGAIRRKEGGRGGKTHLNKKEQEGSKKKGQGGHMTGRLLV